METIFSYCRDLNKFTPLGTQLIHFTEECSLVYAKIEKEFTIYDFSFRRATKVDRIPILSLSSSHFLHSFSLLLSNISCIVVNLATKEYLTFPHLESGERNKEGNEILLCIIRTGTIPIGTWPCRVCLLRVANFRATYFVIL